MKINYSILFLLFFGNLVSVKPKILHLTFHRGCLNEIDRVGKLLGVDITSFMIQDMPSKWLDGKAIGNEIYNITHQRAHDAWQKHKVFFNMFDGVITSDTTPLARIFLQNDWNKPLIIWICNRFDYGIEPHDREYYSLYREALKNSQVKIIGYTPFEITYARIKGVPLNDSVIKPCTLSDEFFEKSVVPHEIDRKNTFFLPPYHNETNYMNFSEHCTKLGIQNYCGRYNGPQDLRSFKGIIHIPYALSNLALLENIQYGLIYFVPSKKFIKELAQKPNFWFQDFNMNSIEYSEWYLPENAPLFVYFDSWKDLKNKIKILDYDKKREEILVFAKNHTITMLGRWEEVFKTFGLI